MKTKITCTAAGSPQKAVKGPALLSINRSWKHLFAMWSWTLLLLTAPVAVKAQLTFITNNGAITITGCTGNPTTLTIPSTTNTYNVVSIEDSAFFNQSNVTTVTIIGNILTNIGNSAFSGCGLTNFALPSNLRGLGTNAFANCTNLTNFNFNSDVNITNIPDGMFSGCSKLSSPGQLSSVGDITGIGNSAFAGCGFTNFNLSLFPTFKFLGTNAFANCTNLTNFSFNNDANITNIPDGMFSGCSKLSSPGQLSSVGDITAIGNSAFAGCGFTNFNLSLFPTFKFLGTNAFANCTNLTNFSFNSDANITNIPDGMFSGCSKLSSPGQLSSVGDITGIGNSAFAGCGFTNFNLSLFPTFKFLGTNAFANCTNLTNFSFNSDANITNIPDGMFSGCSKLSSPGQLSSVGDITGIGNSAFAGCGFTNFTLSLFPPLKFLGTNAFANCTNLTNFNFNSDANITNIPDGMFSGCSKFNNQAQLTGIGHIIGIGNSSFAGCGFTNFSLATGFSSGFGSLGTNAFANCTNLTGFTFNNNITSIPSTTFYNDANLSSITIPASVTNIGDGAFEGCSSLANLYFQGNAPTLGGPNVFTGVNAATAVVNYLDSTGGWGSMYGPLNTSAEVEFTYTVTNGVVTITGYTGSGGVITIPSTITGLPVTSVGAQAFYNSTTLMGVTIGTNVTDISEEAFYDCASLTNVMIVNSVTNIGEGAFWGCSGLLSVAIPNSVTSLGDYPFVDCFDLTNIAVAASNPAYSSAGGVLFDKPQGVLLEFPGGLGGNYTIPASVASIAIGAFGDCTNLTNVNIGTNVTDIEYQSFYGCTTLTNIMIPDSVTNLGDYAFQYCSGLTSVTIPDGVTSIGAAPFADCAILTNIAVAASNSAFSSVGGVLFDQAQSMFIEFPAGLGGNYNIPISVTNIGDEAFEDCSGLTSVTIPNTVTSIGDEAFEGCSGLTSVTIPDSITSIGAWTFANCFNLTNVAIPDSVTSIGYESFGGCFHMTSVTIPASVTSIGDYAFSQCFSLNTLLFQGNAPVLGGTNVFSDDNTTAVVNYLPGTTNWGATYGGLLAVELTPQIVSGSPCVSANVFSFTISGASAMVVAVEASTDLINWQPIQTNTLTNATFNFSDPQWTNYPNRSYRLRSP